MLKSAKDKVKKKEGYKRKFKGVTFETLFTRNYIQDNIFQEIYWDM